ncbi:MAG TPA: acetate/propionate family kinase [Acidobacteriaceae bacterium]|nr:acetate/propionate family kinase [Acidobacteriaceae bacterium]
MAPLTESGDLLLAVNSGSSSLKFGLYRCSRGECDPGLVLNGGATGIGHANGHLKIEDSDGRALVDQAYKLSSQGEAMREILDAIAQHAGQKPEAVGHRMVHGGPHLREHQIITPALMRTLEAATQFAPIHIPAALKLLRETEKLLPGVSQYACFDTAFHRTMPESSRHYPLPERLYTLGVERFGFHGLSYESIVERLGDELPARVVCAHLGSGASLVALHRGRSIDTSMGMTPVGGIPMATRSGDFDPGILLFLMRTEQLNADQLESLLNRDSGLGAIAGGESDMRLLEQAASQGDAHAKLAIEIFAIAVRKFIGAYAAELGGLDLLVFTGGIGENSAPIRNRICHGLDFLGVTGGEPATCPKVRVLPAEEELQIARITSRLTRQPAR